MSLLSRTEVEHVYVFDEDWDGLCAKCGGEQDDPLHVPERPPFFTGDFDDVQETE